MMDHYEEIRHEGIISGIEGNTAKVTILVKSACSECHIKGACNLAEVQAKIIEVDLKGQNYKIGDRVNVVLKESLGMKAVWYAYLIPVILIIVTLFLTNTLFDNENLTALISIIVAGFYYLMLYFRRQKLKKTFTFHLEK